MYILILWACGPWEFGCTYQAEYSCPYYKINVKYDNIIMYTNMCSESYVYSMLLLSVLELHQFMHEYGGYICLFITCIVS